MKPKRKPTLAQMKKPILDACCGSRMFWFDPNNPKAIFIDKRNESFDACHALLSQELERERTMTKKLEAALEFYADKDNWSETYHEHGDEQMDIPDRIDFDDVEWFKDETDTDAYAGRRARQALRDLRGEATGEGEKS